MDELLSFEEVYSILSGLRYDYWMDGKTPMVDKRTVEACLTDFFVFVSKFGMTDPPRVRNVLTKLCKEK